MVTAIFPAGVQDQLSDTLHVYKSRHSENHDIIKQEFSTGLSARGRLHRGKGLAGESWIIYVLNRRQDHEGNLSCGRLFLGTAEVF